MSKKNRDRQATSPPAPPPGPITYTTSLKPQRKAMIVLAIIFSAWVALLLVLYFTTVYPAHH